MNIFMKAAKKKLRFDTDRGTLSVECLFDLDLDELNSLVIRLRDEASEADEGGYLEELSGSKAETGVKLRFQVAEAIIIERVAEVKAREQAAENKQKRDRLLAIIASKEAQALEENDIESLKAMAEALS